MLEHTKFIGMITILLFRFRKKVSFNKYIFCYIKLNIGVGIYIDDLSNMWIHF